MLSMDANNLVTSVMVLTFDHEKTGSYIEVQPDMEPLQEELSVCAWVKKLVPGDHPIWLDYAMSGNADAMCISDNEYWNTMINQGTHDYKNKASVTMGTWHHHCSTWKRSTGTWRVYHDGFMLGESKKTGGTLNLGGYLVIGDEAKPNGLNGAGTSYYFGGELTKMNIFSKELNSSEVQEMTRSGILTNVEMNHEEHRYIKWEDILMMERTGNVTDRVMTQCDSVSTTVLSFNSEKTGSYIEVQPDMEPLQEELSVCAWVKKVRPGDHAIWFDYAMSGNADAMCISDTENWNTMINQGTHSYKKPVKTGGWNHHCSTWRRSTGTWRVYHDGVMLGEQTKPGGTLDLGGYLVIGDEAKPNGLNGEGTSYYFGGELTKLNMFSKELNSTEVKEMFDAGMFSNVEMNHEVERYLKWEDILMLERTGDVQDWVLTEMN